MDTTGSYWDFRECAWVRCAGSGAVSPDEVLVQLPLQRVDEGVPEVALG